MIEDDVKADAQGGGRLACDCVNALLPDAAALPPALRRQFWATVLTIGLVELIEGLGVAPDDLRSWLAERLAAAERPAAGTFLQ